LAIFATLAAFGGLVFLLLGAYLSLAKVLQPWQAGAIVGGAMILIAFIALWIIAGAITKQGRMAAPPPSPSGTFATAGAPQPPGSVPDTLRAAIGEMLGATGVKTSDIAIGALVAGLVLGASPRLRQRLFRSITKE